MLASLDRTCPGTRSRDTFGKDTPQLLREDAEGIGPELLDGAAEARLVAQALGPHLRVEAVVDLLAVHLRGEPGHLRVVGLPEPREAELVGGLVQPVTRDRVRPVESPQLD